MVKSLKSNGFLKEMAQTIVGPILQQLKNRFGIKKPSYKTKKTLILRQPMHLKKNLSVYHPDGYTRMVKKFIKTDGFFAQLEDGSTVEISRAKKDEFIDKVA